MSDTSAPEFQPPAETPPVVTTLEDVGEALDPTRIQRVWIFPPRRAAGTETAVAVLALSPDDDDRRLLIFAAHYTASRDRRGRLHVQHSLVEHAAALPGRVDSVIEGVLRRLDESLPSLPPRVERIDGDLLRWHALLESLRSSPPPVAWSGDTHY